MGRGRLITIEGIDGAGKTTLATALTRELAARGQRVQQMREPGGVATSERIRDLVQDAGLNTGSRAETLLYAAARAQLVEERLEPLLSDGVWVILDRFVDSSLAYQGAARALGIEAVADLNRFATGGLAADRTLLVRLDPVHGRKRQLDRGETPDRIELEGADFYEAVARAYDEIAAAEPERVRTIDGNLTAEEVAQAALEAIADLLP